MNPLTKVTRQLIVATSLFTMVAVSEVMADTAAAAHATTINSAVFGGGFLGDRFVTKIGARPNQLAPVSINRSASEITFTTIDFPGSGILQSGVIGFNNRGQIVGNYYEVSSDRYRGYLLDHGTFTTIDFPGAFWTQNGGINNRGQIVGFYYDVSFMAHAYLLDNGAFTTIDLPDHAGLTFAGRINNLGQILGDYEDASTPGDHVFLLDHGTFTTIDFPGAIFTGPGDINDRGQIVGLYLDADFNAHGFLLDHGTFTTIDFPSATPEFTSLSSINNLGQIVGGYYDFSSNTFHSFLLDNGAFTTIDLPGAISTVVGTINDRDQITGSYDDASGVAHGFVAELKRLN
jgi:uncharacterized membrane protein